MNIKILTLCLLFSLIYTKQLSAQSKSRISVAGGAEWGWIHNKAVGKNYHQSGQANKYYGEFIYRYNGLNNLVVTGGYIKDSLNFRNTNPYLIPTTNGHYQITAFNTYGLIKTESVFLGVAYLLSVGSTVGVDFQMGVSGKYIFDAIRYEMPHEVYQYALRDEIQPFNILLQPRMALRFSYLRLGVSYEMPLWDNINHDNLLKNQQGKSRNSDMQGVRMDNPILFFSASLIVPLSSN